MSVESHTADIFAKEFLHLPEPVRRAAMEFARLAEEICRSDRQGMDIAEIEQHVVSAVAATGLMLLKGLIEERDDGAGSIRHAGKTWHRVAPSRGTVTCLLGKLEYERPLYRCRSERRSLCPVDDSLGLLPGSMTRPAGKLAAYMVSQCTPRQSGLIFDRSGGMAPSVSSMQRLMGDLHWAWQGIEEDALDDIRAGQEIPAGAASVSVSLDGAMVLLRPGEGPGGDGPERNWREAACGTLSFHDAEGACLSTISSGRMPQGGKTDLKRWLAQECSHVLKRRPDLTLLAIADGAADNWTSALHCSLCHLRSGWLCLVARNIMNSICFPRKHDFWPLAPGSVLTS